MKVTRTGWSPSKIEAGPSGFRDFVANAKPHELRDVRRSSRFCSTTADFPADLGRQIDSANDVFDSRAPDTGPDSTAREGAKQFCEIAVFAFSRSFSAKRARKTLRYFEVSCECSV